VYSTTLQAPDTARTRIERDFDPDVGGGTRALPDQVRLNLTLAEERKFGNGSVYLCYRLSQ